MPLTQPQMRAIEIMAEQMERLLPEISRARHETPPRSPEEVVREFYNDSTRLGQFELRYLDAIGRSLAPDATYEDGIVVHRM